MALPYIFCSKKMNGNYNMHFLLSKGLMIIKAVTTTFTIHHQLFLVVL
jgi:hypothetical protein